MLDKDELPDYMQSFPNEISEDLKKDLNKHIAMILKQNCGDTSIQTTETEQPADPPRASTVTEPPHPQGILMNSSR